jgi:hypothetical protein
MAVVFILHNPINPFLDKAWKTIGASMDYGCATGGFPLSGEIPPKSILTDFLFFDFEVRK